MDNWIPLAVAGVSLAGTVIVAWMAAKEQPSTVLERTVKAQQEYIETLEGRVEKLELELIEVKRENRVLMNIVTSAGKSPSSFGSQGE